MTALSLNGCVIALRMDTWPIRMPAYRGVCKGLWWPLTRYGDAQTRPLTARLETEFLSRPFVSRSPNVTSNAELLRSYIVECERLSLAPLYALACSSLEPEMTPCPTWLLTLQAAADHIGIDITYPTGSYSFINDNYYPNGSTSFGFLAARLNRNLLFDSIDDANEFMGIHQQAIDAGAKLETLDGAILVDLWECQDLSSLKQALGSR